MTGPIILAVMLQSLPVPGGAGSGQAMSDHPFARVLPARTLADPAQCGTDQGADGRLDLQTRFSVQNTLSRLGFPVGRLDGIFGPRTRAAIARWQEAVGCGPTGYLTPEQVNMLRDQTRGERGPSPPARPGVVPDGKPAPQDLSRKAPENRTDPARDRAKAQENALQLNVEDRVRVEKLLVALGRDPGVPDGRFDAATRAAIVAQQTLWAFPPTGYLDDVTYVRMLSLGILR